MKKVNLWGGIFLLLLSGCVSQGILPSNHTGQTECLGDLLDGHIRVRVWGAGLTKPDAIQMAQKNAVSDLLFEGIRRGNPGCQQPPLMPGPNADERHAAFFAHFFKDAGDYKKFTQVEKVTGFYRIAGSRQFVARVQLRLDKRGLHREMERLK